MYSIGHVCSIMISYLQVFSKRNVFSCMYWHHHNVFYFLVFTGSRKSWKMCTRYWLVEWIKCLAIVQETYTLHNANRLKIFVNEFHQCIFTSFMPICSHIFMAYCIHNTLWWQAGLHHDWQQKLWSFLALHYNIQKTAQGTFVSSGKLIFVAFPQKLMSCLQRVHFIRISHLFHLLGTQNTSILCSLLR